MLFIFPGRRSLLRQRRETSALQISKSLHHRCPSVTKKERCLMGEAGLREGGAQRRKNEKRKHMKNKAGGRKKQGQRRMLVIDRNGENGDKLRKKRLIAVVDDQVEILEHWLVTGWWYLKWRAIVEWSDDWRVRFSLACSSSLIHFSTLLSEIFNLWPPIPKQQNIKVIIFPRCSSNYLSFTLHTVHSGNFAGYASISI